MKTAHSLLFQFIPQITQHPNTVEHHKQGHSISMEKDTIIILKSDFSLSFHLDWSWKEFFRCWTTCFTSFPRSIATITTWQFFKSSKVENSKFSPYEIYQSLMNNFPTYHFEMKNLVGFEKLILNFTWKKLEVLLIFITIRLFQGY